MTTPRRRPRRPANGLNQYASVNGTGYAYDGRGNLTSDGTRAFSYDLENHLLTASAPTPVTLSYDPLGRLQTSTASGVTTTFLYDGDNLIAEYNGATFTRRYGFGAGEDEPLAWFDTAFIGAHYLHADRQGSILAWSDASGNRVGARTYGPYGEPIIGAAPTLIATGAEQGNDLLFAAAGVTKA